MSEELEQRILRSQKLNGFALYGMGGLVLMTLGFAWWFLLSIEERFVTKPVWDITIEGIRSDLAELKRNVSDGNEETKDELRELRTQLAGFQAVAARLELELEMHRNRKGASSDDE